MHISLDYQVIEVNIDVAIESYATGYNCMDKATQICYFVLNQT